MARLLAAAIIAAFLGIPYTTANDAEAPFGITVSSTSKKSPSTRRQEPGQIACTVSGCQRVPPNCHPETGYNWDGMPTGFDIVVCRSPRGRRG